MSSAPQHVAAVALLRDRGDTPASIEVFLSTHAKTKAWHVPGGKVELDEQHLAAAQREMYEEHRVALASEDLHKVGDIVCLPVVIQLFATFRWSVHGCPLAAPVNAEGQDAMRWVSITQMHEPRPALPSLVRCQPALAAWLRAYTPSPRAVVQPDHSRSLAATSVNAPTAPTLAQLAEEAHDDECRLQGDGLSSAMSVYANPDERTLEWADLGAALALNEHIDSCTEHIEDEDLRRLEKDIADFAAEERSGPLKRQRMPTVAPPVFIPTTYVNENGCEVHTVLWEDPSYPEGHANHYCLLKEKQWEAFSIAAA
jgi:8-oxo-dGTP pyrophosphatase MutT (NUDIX family)